jgi:hypothetical protein
MLHTATRHPWVTMLINSWCLLYGDWLSTALHVVVQIRILWSGSGSGSGSWSSELTLYVNFLSVNYSIAINVVKFQIKSNFNLKFSNINRALRFCEYRIDSDRVSQGMGQYFISRCAKNSCLLSPYCQTSFHTCQHLILPITLLRIGQQSWLDTVRTVLRNSEKCYEVQYKEN